MYPEGFTASEFEGILAEFRTVVGNDWVINSVKTGLNSYLDTFSMAPPESRAPSAAIAPADVDEVQAVLTIANAHGVPLWVFSTGKNFAYGGPAPMRGGYVVLDLKRMNRIIEVNEDLAYALVEPGVTYQALYDYLQKNKIKLWIDCAAPAWGSVMGNALDHGAGYTPYGDHLAMQCGMEVVLADGEIFRTGMGALPGNNTWQLFKWGYGPVLDGLFTQSNFGVVTKMGIWLMPEPSGYRPFMITFQREDDLHDITEILRPLKINMVIPNAATTVDLVWEAAVKVTRRHYYRGSGPLPDSVRRKIASDLKIGMWNFYGALYGPEPIMDAQWSVIRDAFARIPGARFYTAADRKGDTAFEYREKLMRGEPNMTEFSTLNWTGGGGHVGFAPISPTTGADAMKQYEMVRRRHHEFGLDYAGEFIIGWREMHHVLLLIFDRTDSGIRERAQELMRSLIADAAAAGYGEYRTHLDFMDQVAATYSWNDGALARVQAQIKDALDPNGILSPGKNGIWPRHLREGRKT